MYSKADLLTLGRFCWWLFQVLQFFAIQQWWHPLSAVSMPATSLVSLVTFTGLLTLLTRLAPHSGRALTTP